MSTRDTRPPMILIRSQKLHDANVCLQQTIRIRLSDRETLIATIEETTTSLEDVSGWFKQAQVNR